MHLSRNAARALNFAVITIPFLLMDLLMSSSPETATPLFAIVTAAVQAVLFILVDRIFNIESKTKLRQILKCILASVGIIAVTCTVLGVLRSGSYSVYTYGDAQTPASFLSAIPDTAGGPVYAACQLLPVLMFLSLVFDKVFFFPAVSVYSCLCVIANNTAAAFGPFSEFNGIVREYTVGNFAGSVNTAVIVLLIVSAVVSAADLIIHRPKKRQKIRYFAAPVLLCIAVVFALLTFIASASGLSFK